MCSGVLPGTQPSPTLVPMWQSRLCGTTAAMVTQCCVAIYDTSYTLAIALCAITHAHKVSIGVSSLCQCAVPDPLSSQPEEYSKPKMRFHANASWCVRACLRACATRESSCCIDGHTRVASREYRQRHMTVRTCVHPLVHAHVAQVYVNVCMLHSGMCRHVCVRPRTAAQSSLNLGLRRCLAQQQARCMGTMGQQDCGVFGSIIRR